MEGHRDDENVRRALEELKKVCSEFKLLGSYPRGKGSQASEDSSVQGTPSAG